MEQHWYYNNEIVEELPEGSVGFVYLITNLTNNRKYIGKKLAQFKRTKPPLKGRKNKRRSTVESDWREYYGSSDELSADVAELGPQSFKREILFYCTSKSLFKLEKVVFRFSSILGSFIK